MEKESKTNVTLECTREHNKILIKFIKYCKSRTTALQSNLKRSK